MWSRFGSNALANVLTGGSAVVFQLGLTALATRSFDAATFSVWTLALSMAGLVPLFTVNLSSVVTRQLVPALAARRHGQIGLVITAAQRLGIGLAVMSVLVIMLAAVGLHRASPALASTGTGTFLLAVLLLTVGQLWQITIQPAMAWHYAREDNWPGVIALLLIRMAALIAMWLATRALTGDLLATALCLAIGYWLGMGFAYTRSFKPKLDQTEALVGLTTQILETARLLRWFAIWSVGMAAIQYGLPQVMSVLGAAHYNAFYLAYTLNLVVSGISAAIGSAMLAPVARFVASGNKSATLQALMHLPTGIAFILVSMLYVMYWSMPFLIKHWSHGIATATAVNSYLFLLGLQTIGRSLPIAFAMVLASRATGLKLVGPSLLELAIVLLVAIPLGSIFGERAFLLALTGAGVSAALATAAMGLRAANLETRDRHRVLTRFIATEICALAVWWGIAGS